MDQEEYPQCVSPLERELGFELQRIPGIAHSTIDNSEVPLVVAKVLSSCEVVLKARDLAGNICYNIRKYGYYLIYGEETPYCWHPVISDCRDPKEIVDIYKKRTKTIWEKLAGQIHGVSLPFEKPPQE